MRFKVFYIKNWCLYILMLLFLASCSDQQVMEGSASSQKLAEQKRMTVSPQDSVMSLLNQARRGDGSAYLKLADCYCDGFGVKKDFFGMITMAQMAECRGGIKRMEDYIYDMPDGNDYKTLFLLMEGYKSYHRENTDSVEQVLCKNETPEAKTLIGIITIDKGDLLLHKFCFHPMFGDSWLWLCLLQIVLQAYSEPILRWSCYHEDFPSSILSIVYIPLICL